MLLNTKELLALASGDVEPDQLAVLLDRLDDCPDSAAALEVLVSLKANREEALEALRMAAESDASVPVPFRHPAALQTRSTGWATHGLRLAASIALVGILGVWAANWLFVPEGASTTALASTEYFNIIAGRAADLTAESQGNIIEGAIRHLDAKRFPEAHALLENQPYDAHGMVPLLLGMSQYFLGDPEMAAATLGPIQSIPNLSTLVRYQALWYEANALLALDRPLGALPHLETITKSDPRFGFPFSDDAAVTFGALCTLLGIDNCKSQN